MRVACLVPSATDLAARLGLNIVGVSHECDHPAARGLPVLTRSNVAEVHGPGAVDRAVREAVAEGGALYVVDRDKLAALAPDVVLSQAICDVCAARMDPCELPRGARLLELSAMTLAGLLKDVRAVAAACGVPERGEACVAEIAEALAAVVPAEKRRRVLTLEWADPPFLGGHWVPELVERAGGEHLLSVAGDRSRTATWAEIEAAAAEVVVFMPCGYTLDAAVAEARALVAPRVAGELWATAATALFSRCTPQSVTLAARVLAGLLRGESQPGLAVEIRRS